MVGFVVARQHRDWADFVSHASRPSGKTLRRSGLSVVVWGLHSLATHNASLRIRDYFVTAQAASLERLGACQIVLSSRKALLHTDFRFRLDQPYSK